MKRSTEDNFVIGFFGATVLLTLEGKQNNQGQGLRSPFFFYAICSLSSCYSYILIVPQKIDR